MLTNELANPGPHQHSSASRGHASYSSVHAVCSARLVPVCKDWARRVFYRSRPRDASGCPVPCRGERRKERRGETLFEFARVRVSAIPTLAPPEVICRSFSWPLREVIQGGLAARREGPRAVCQNARQEVVSHHAGTVLLVCLPKVKDSARMDTHQHARRGNAPGEAARRPPIGSPVRLRYVCAASALESTGPAVGAGSRRSSAKYRADLLQDPEKSQDNTVVDASKRLFAGGVAGAIAKTAIAPLDRVKIIFQTHPAKRFSLRNVVLELTGIHAREGVKGLWRGNAATVLRVFPYAGIQFAAFDIYKRLLGNASSAQKVLAGSAAGATAVVITYPLDLIRARLAVRMSEGPLSRAAWVDAITGGRGTVSMKELYRGLSPTLIGILPYAGIAFFIRDVLNQVRAHVYVRMSARTPTPTRTCTCIARRMERQRDIDRQAGRQTNRRQRHARG